MVEIIAEIANAHQGKPKEAIKLARAAFLSGADSVKFQVYFANDFISKNHSKYHHFKNQSFSKKDWNKIIFETKKLGVKIYCDVLGEEAFKFVEKFNIDGYKIHSSDISNFKLIKNISRINKKLFISTGGVKIPELYEALKILKNYKNEIIFMHGFQSYPTDLKDTQLQRIQYLKNEFGDKVNYGYQDHVSGGSPNNIYTCLVALGFGTTYIEKHITFNRKKRGIDYYSSIEPIKFKRFVNIIKSNHKSIPLKINDFSKKEYIYRKQTKKMMLLKKNKKKGQLVKKSDIIYKRCETTCLEPLDLSFLKNKKLVTNLEKNEILKKKHFVNKVIIIVVARVESKRLPNKALLKINNQSLIEHLLIRLNKNKKNKELLLCTTKRMADNQLIKICKKNNIKFFRGSIENVLDRIINGIKKYQHNIIVRITGDDILIDTDYMDIAINHLIENNLDYVDHKDLPSGTETEIFDRETLTFIHRTANDLTGTEYLTNYIKNNKIIFKTDTAPVLKKHASNLRLTIDTKKDFIFVKDFLIKMEKLGKINTYNLDEIIKFYKNKTNEIKKTKLFNNYRTSLNLKKYYEI